MCKMTTDIPFIKKIGKKLRPKSSAKEIKCVLVGDNGIGKTKLILSYIHNSPRVAVESLNSPLHTPSIFTNRENDYSKSTQHCHLFENRDVKLVLWDTFGDHKQERGYSYNDADVICICFNVGNIGSLESIASHWLPETQRNCPDAPIVLVGLQADRRHNDPSKYVSCKRKIHSLDKYLQSHVSGSTSVKDNPITNPTIEPEICRKVSSDIGALLYFETSVSTKFGVFDLFSAAAQLGMMRKLKKLNNSSASSLRRFEDCHLKADLMQAPYLHKQNLPPRIETDIPRQLDVFFPSLYKEVLTNTPSASTDVEFVFRDQSVFAHSLVLTLCVPALRNVFRSVVATSQGNSDQISKITEELSAFKDFHVLNSPLEYQPRFRFIMAGEAVVFQRSLELYYTGSLSNTSSCIGMAEMARSCCFDEVVLFLNLTFTQPVTRDLLALHAKNAAREFLENDFLADLTFGIGKNLVQIPAHKLILSQRSEVFSAMLTNGEFAERLYSKIDFRDTNLESFRAVLEYLYTGECTDIPDMHGTLQLANFLCLRHLVALCEERITKRISQMKSEENPDVYEYVIESFILGEYHNAPQLSAWCLHFMCTNYNALCRSQGNREMKNALDKKTLDHLEENRWPPVWYLKEQDYYERTVRRLASEQHKKREEKKRRRMCSGCF